MTVKERIAKITQTVEIAAVRNPHDKGTLSYMLHSKNWWENFWAVFSFIFFAGAVMTTIILTLLGNGNGPLCKGIVESRVSDRFLNEYSAVAEENRAVMFTAADGITWYGLRAGGVAAYSPSTMSVEFCNSGSDVTAAVQVTSFYEANSVLYLVSPQGLYRLVKNKWQIDKAFE